MKIHWKLKIDQKFRVGFQISQLINIPQKWFSTQKGPLDVIFLMRLTPNFFFILEKNYDTIFWRILKRLFHDSSRYKKPTRIRSVSSKSNYFLVIFAGWDIWKTTLTFCQTPGLGLRVDFVFAKKKSRASATVWQILRNQWQSLRNRTPHQTSWSKLMWIKAKFWSIL